jgi:hypothetical protein
MKSPPASPPRFWFTLDEKHLWIGSDAPGTEAIIEECLTAATKRAVKDRKLNLAKKSEARNYEATKPEHVQVTGALAFKDPIAADVQSFIRTRLVEYMDANGLRLQSE